MKKGSSKQPGFEAFKKLDDEIKLQIFSFLPHSELVKMSLIDKDTKELVDRKEIWQERIRLCFPYLEKIQNELFFEDPKNLFKLECLYYNKFIKKYEKNSFPANLEQIISLINGETKELDQKLEELDREIEKQIEKEKATNSDPREFKDGNAMDLQLKRGRYADFYGLTVLANPELIDERKWNVRTRSTWRITDADYALELILRSKNTELLEKFKDTFYVNAFRGPDRRGMEISRAFEKAVELGDIDVINKFISAVPEPYLDVFYDEIIVKAIQHGRKELLEDCLNKISPEGAQTLGTLEIMKAAVKHCNHSELSDYVENFKFKETRRSAP